MDSAFNELANRIVIGVGTMALLLLFRGWNWINSRVKNKTARSRLIIKGYDPVAYFTINKPVKGEPKISYRYKGGLYHFATEHHLDLFKANPEKYKPQFGGWCAYAVSQGWVAPIDVEFFSVEDGRLTLYQNKHALEKWNESATKNLILARGYWDENSRMKDDHI